MGDELEFDPVDAIAAGAVGEPGARTFMIQARKGDALLAVVVEKEQVALLAAEATQFLDRLDDAGPGVPAAAGEVRDVAPLFRARLIGLGYDPARRMVVIELREDDEEDSEEGQVARLFATAAQVRAMAEQGAAAVVSGRPLCPLCDFPMDPDRHICPRWN